MGGTQPKDSKNLAGNRNSRLQSEIHWHRTGTHGNAVWDSLAGNRLELKHPEIHWLGIGTRGNASRDSLAGNRNSWECIQRFIGWE